MVKVLIVDDEASILESTAVILQEYGFHSAVVSAARHVLPSIRAETPDVVLQDVRMPGLVLPELIAEIRREHGRLPVVLFSASISLPELQNVYDVDAAVEKPFHPDVLVSALRAAVAKRQAPEAPA